MSDDEKQERLKFIREKPGGFWSRSDIVLLLDEIATRDATIAALTKERDEARAKALADACLAARRVVVSARDVDGEDANLCDELEIDVEAAIRALAPAAGEG